MPETLGLAPKRDVILQTNRINLQDSVRNYWVATVEPHITREDLLKPDFWANIAVAFKQFDRIEVRQDDGKFFAEYLILNSDKNSAYLKELTWLDLDDKPKGSKAEFKYKYRGPYAKHSIIRTKDDSVMVEKLETKIDAEKWLADHLRKI